MKKIVIANWKMNPATPRQALHLARGIERGSKNTRNVDIFIAPPFVFLQLIAKRSKFKIAAQNVFYENLPGGARTGEISPAQLKALGVRLIIIGHSERRALGETDEIIRKKLKAALEAGFKAVLCVGEKERKQEEVFPPLVRREIHEDLRGIKKSYLRNLIIAYEPIWAISGFGGEADTPKEVYEISLLIRRELYKMFGKKIASAIPLLYGGSVTGKNAAGFLNAGAVDGFLVGGASLNFKSFVKIIKEAAAL